MAICLARPLQQVRYRGNRPDQRQVALRSLRRETNQSTAEPVVPEVPGSPAFPVRHFPNGQRLSRSLSSETLAPSGADEHGGLVQELLFDRIGIRRLDARADG